MVAGLPRRLLPTCLVMGDWRLSNYLCPSIWVPDQKQAKGLNMAVQKTVADWEFMILFVALSILFGVLLGLWIKCC